MIKINIIILFILYSSISYGKQIRVAVLDTGINWKNHTLTLCKTGHRDFTGTSLEDSQFHGQNVSHLIEREATSTNYCQIIIKIFANKSTNSDRIIINALKYIQTLNVDVINLSYVGETPWKEEKDQILKLLDKKIFIFAAAGNSNFNLNKNCTFFPACYDPRIFVIGNISANGEKHESSNYGNCIDFYANGVDQSAGGITASGTSQSTAIMTGKFIKLMDLINKKNLQRKKQ